MEVLRTGHFYASTGARLHRLGRVGDELVIEVASVDPVTTIGFIVDGGAAVMVTGTRARHAIPEHGYVRAVVTLPDGTKAWTQPFRR